jgi:DNA primase
MRFPPSFLDEIRDRVPISQVIGSSVTWDRRKTNASRGDWWACCPFHGEKTPSFHCEDRKGRYHCFGCGASGDHFRFLTEHEGLSFPEAVERVAAMAGVPIPLRDPQAEQREKTRAGLHDVMELACSFFERALHEQEGARARAYLRDRGLSPATQQRFRLGYAPESRNALKSHLAEKGVDLAAMEACGLLVSGPDIPVSFDRFRDRIIFPILDTRGRVVAFGGRALSPDVPAKYLNSPETELFHKGQMLYNLAAARRAHEKSGTVVVVEGYMDVIALAQAGIENAVAPLGTALTEEQIALLWRIADEPILCFDGDQAGLRAAWRAADLALGALRPGRSLRFAMLPQGQDPDDLVRAGGVAAMHAVLEAARPLADILWTRETAEGVFDTPERRARLERRIAELTGRIGDEAVRRHYAQDMRDRLAAFFGPGVSRDAGRRAGPRSGNIQRGAQARGRIPVSESLARSALVGGGVMPAREAALIVAAINHPPLISSHFDQIERLELTSPALRRLHGAILDALARGEATDRQTLTAALETAGLSGSLAEAEGLVRRLGIWPALPDAALEDAASAFQQALHLHEARHALHKELKSAEAAMAAEPTEENYRNLLAVKTLFRQTDTPEALIEGFGVLSGRVARS